MSRNLTPELAATRLRSRRRHSLHPRLLIHARGGYISADFGHINGEVVQAQAGAEFMFTRSLGVGVSYSHNRLSLSVDDDDFRGNVRFSFSGPQVYAVLAF